MKHFARTGTRAGHIILQGERMEYAFSLCQNAMMHARVVDYDDCRELQIVCPACHEALFKRGSPFTKREYFATIPRDPEPNANCGFAQSSRRRSEQR